MKVRRTDCRGHLVDCSKASPRNCNYNRLHNLCPAHHSLFTDVFSYLAFIGVVANHFRLSSAILHFCEIVRLLVNLALMDLHWSSRWFAPGCAFSELDIEISNKWKYNTAPPWCRHLWFLEKYLYGRLPWNLIMKNTSMFLFWLFIWHHHQIRLLI